MESKCRKKLEINLRVKHLYLKRRQLVYDYLLFHLSIFITNELISAPQSLRILNQLRRCPVCNIADITIDKRDFR